MFIQLTGFGRWTKCQFICLWWVIFLWIIHSYLIRDTNKKMLKTLYFVWSSGSPLFYLFDFILSERACHGSDEWDSTRSAYRVSLRKVLRIMPFLSIFYWPTMNVQISFVARLCHIMTQVSLPRLVIILLCDWSVDENTFLSLIIINNILTLWKHSHRDMCVGAN